MATSADSAVAALRELPEALILVFDRDLRFVMAAGQAFARNDKAPTYREGQLLADALPEGVWTLIEPLCRSALEGDTRSREIWTANHRHCLRVDIGPLRLDSPVAQTGTPVVAGGVAVVLDITARRLADKLGRDAREHFEQVFEQAPIGMGLLDQEGRWVLVNQALCDITGYTSAEMIGVRFQDITHPDDVDNDVAGRERLLVGEIPAFQTEQRYVNAAGETTSAMLSVSLVRDRDGEPLHFIAQILDISERKQLEEHLRHLADHDPLTGLRNRRLFEHDLKLQIGRCKRYGEQAALVVIDLDSFKQINDCHGHKAGDDTLRVVARTLTRRLRTTDLMARIGGDEFAALLPHTDRQGAEIVAENLTRVIADCGVDAGDVVLHVSGSVGFTLLDEHTESDEQALIAADQAMYAAKRAKTLEPVSK